MRYCKCRVKRFSNKKLYTRLARLQEYENPNLKAIHVLLSEIESRDPAEYEAGIIEAKVEQSKRFAVREVDEILHYEIKYNEDYLAKPEAETDPFERKLRAAKLAMVQDVLNRRNKTRQEK
ncbi:hypothetical protein [Planococcus sp. 107-1]|uniref:hypothetical protein n=1 Tax=Planococcus sp. 107-1 TaxID=2908840 RepID=UPI001F403EAB|nr:hypothetical protein [Planococcus sp. 107-1]UJF25534.1 hypothetical protein L0M13_09655 [Planococcus sp. 107-1]